MILPAGRVRRPARVRPDRIEIQESLFVHETDSSGMT